MAALAFPPPKRARRGAREEEGVGKEEEGAEDAITRVELGREGGREKMKEETRDKHSTAGQECNVSML